MEANLEIIGDFSKYLKSGGKSQATIDCYCRDARYFFAYINTQGIDFAKIESQTLLEYKDFLEVTDKENSIRRKVISIRQLFRYLKMSHHIRSTPFDDVPIPMRDESIPLHLDDEAIDKVFDFYSHLTHHSLKLYRDAALLFLLGKEGIKADELIHLKWSHLMASCSNPTLFIPGKRGRTIAIGQHTSTVLDSYKLKLQRYQEESPRSQKGEAIFVAFKGKECSLVIPQMTRHGLKFAL